LVTGSIAGALALVMLLVAFVIYAVAYAIFCVFYAFYGSVLYVCGPLVLALYPALSTTQLARTYLLGGHFKTGHTWSLQNRPTDRTQDMKLFYLAGASSRKRFSQSRL